MKYFGIAVITLIFVSAFTYSTKTAKIEHGDYLSNRASMCVDCHTPKDNNGKFDMTKSLEGKPFGMPGATPDPKRPSSAPNLTSTGLAGQWGEKAMINFLMTGKNPDGGSSRPPMPQYRFNKDDANSLYAYMMSLPPKQKPTGTGSSY